SENKSFFMRLACHLLSLYDKITATEEISKRQLLTAICPNFFLMRQHIYKNRENQIGSLY
ncbi:TPA: hypothetical protein ACQN68_001685, partial [Streptococcus pyogenes]